MHGAPGILKGLSALRGAPRPHRSGLSDQLDPPVAEQTTLPHEERSRPTCPGIQGGRVPLRVATMAPGSCRRRCAADLMADDALALCLSRAPWWPGFASGAQLISARSGAGHADACQFNGLLDDPCSSAIE